MTISNDNKFGQGPHSADGPAQKSTDEVVENKALGELSDEGREAVGDLEPADFIREHSSLIKDMRKAYAEIVDEPIPDRFMQLLGKLDESDDT